MIGIRDDGVRRTSRDALWFIVETDAFCAFVESYVCVFVAYSGM